jgi:7-keto-8-aminopelargonate synthetase-like enzyme
MFSHDGGLAPIKDYLRLLPRDAAILLDDAHGAGVLGKTGRGTAEQLGVRSNRIIQTISLSKAFGVYGGAVLGSISLCDRIRGRSHLFGGNTPLLLPVAAAAWRAVGLVKSDKGLRRRLEQNIDCVKAGLRRGGVSVADTPSPIISVTPRHARDAERLRKNLLASRIYPSFIRYPGGAATGYFRFAISSEHSVEQLESLARTLAAGGARGKARNS